MDLTSNLLNYYFVTILHLRVLVKSQQLIAYIGVQ